MQWLGGQQIKSGEGKEQVFGQFLNIRTATYVKISLRVKKVQSCGHNWGYFVSKLIASYLVVFQLLLGECGHLVTHLSRCFFSTGDNTCLELELYWSRKETPCARCQRRLRTRGTNDGHLGRQPTGPLFFIEGLRRWVKQVTKLPCQEIVLNWAPEKDAPEWVAVIHPGTNQLMHFHFSLPWPRSP